MQLVVGTYERFLLGYDVPSDVEAGGALKRAFTHASHQGAVRAVAAAGPYVVSGGSDDQLHLYDVQRGRDLGFLVNPGQGAVTAVSLFTPPARAAPTHLLSGGADGGVAVWRAGGAWEHLKLMRGHSGGVAALAVHPSGALALSVAADRQLRMWDLLRGRCSYTAALGAEGLAVAFGPGGSTYALLAPHAATLHDARGAGPLLGRVESDGVVKFTALGAARADERVLLLGQEDGTLAVWDARISSGGGAAAAALAARVEKAHKTRIRAIVPVTDDAAGPLPRLLSTASSDGAVKIWDARMLLSGSGGGGSGSGANELAVAETRARITCLALSDPSRRAPALAADAGAPAAAAAGAQKQKQKQKPEGKQQQKLKQQQQQPKQKQKQQISDDEGSGDDDGSEDGSGDDDDQQQQQQQQQQRQQAASLKRKLKKQAKLQRRAAIAPDDEALVPRVRTVIKKKKKKAAEDKGDGGGGFGGGGGGGGGGGIRITNHKAPRHHRQ